MAYRHARDRKIWWPTRVARGDIDPATGEVHDDVVRVQYRIFTAAELQEREKATLRTAADEVSQRLARLRVKSADGKSDPDSIAAETQAEIDKAMSAIEQVHADRTADLMARVVGWHADDFRAVDDDGEDAGPLPFDADTLAAVLQDQAMAVAMQAALYEASRGARTKN